MLTYVITELPEDPGFAVHCAQDALPVHWSEERTFANVEEAKAAFPALEWAEPDEECSPDVQAVAVTN